MKKLLLLLPVFVLLTNCIDEIDLTDGEPLPDGVVVTGRLNVEGDVADVEMRLERLFRFGESNRPDRVVNALVTLENSEGQSLVLPFRDDAYRAEFPEADPDFRIEPGIGYRIRANIGEERYLTEFDVLPAALQIGDITTRPGTVERETAAGTIEDAPAIDYLIDAPLTYPDGQPTFIRYTAEQTFKVTDTPMIGPNRNNPPKPCYVTRAVDGDEVTVVSSLTTDATQLMNFPLAAQVIDSRFAEGNVLTAYQEMLTRAAFDYFDQIGSIASTDASIFEPPGGPVVGNASEVNGLTQNVFGFFYATNRSFVRVAVSPDEAGNPTPRCPMPPSMSPFPAPTSCDDCSTLNNSLIERPDWFPF